MTIGEAATLACPMKDAACSVPVASAGIEPRYAGKPRSRSTPNPSAAAAEARAAWSTLVCWEMNAVLHEFATAVVSGICPKPEAG